MSSYRRKPARAFRGLTTSLLLVAAVVLAAAPQASAAPADHLILSEMVVKTRQIQGQWLGSPFIEIVNPTAAAIDMSDVYLTDGTTAPAAYYYNIVHLDPSAQNPGGGNGGDFHARFPAGFSLAGGDTVVIAVNGSTQFQAAYGYDPDFELFEDALTPDNVPELVEAFPGSINAGTFGGGNVPVLSDVAESLILYTWDGSSNLVQDIDYLLWGDLATVRFDKSGMSVGGDTYLADTPVAGQEPAGSGGPTFGAAFRRVDGDEGAETTTGGNGVTGHDETSENLATTWAGVSGQDPGTGTASFPAAPIFSEAGVTPAEPKEGQDALLSVTVVSPGTVTGLEFHYSLDGGTVQTVAGADQGSGVWTYTLTSQTEGTVVAWYATAANDGGGQASWPVSAPLFTSSWTTGAAVVPGDGPTKLLVTEVSTTNTDREYIEIYNPTTGSVDLSDYYLTDANYADGNQYYYRIAEGNLSQSTVGGGDFYDFHARFPDGYAIAAGDTIVVSVAGSAAFESAFGYKPDLELFEDDPNPDNVPDMRWIFGSANNNSIVGATAPTLTDGAETVIFYHWAEGDDNVTDIDVVTWTAPDEDTVNHYFDKTGVTIGSHTYLNEAGTSSSPIPYRNEFGNSYQRTDPNEGTQAPSGSNGVDGRDETSENLPQTFESAPYSPAGPPNLPDREPDKLLITQVATLPVAGEFVEIHNPAAFAVNMGNYYLTDAVNTAANTAYWRIAEGGPSAATIGGGTANDFHARFPDGFSIAAGDTIVVAVAGSGAFEGVYGYLPDLELFEDAGAADDVPDMRWVFGNAADNSITGATDPELADDAEAVLLYNWVENADKVVDIDLFSWRDASGTDRSFLFDKNGVMVGEHTYNPDTPVASQTPFATQPTDGQAYRRTDGSEGTQTPTGSNGVDGRDETSENLPATFAIQAADPAEPPLPPDPDDYPPKLLLTEISTTGNDQEFVEIQNPNAEAVDLSDYYLTDAIYSPGSQHYWRIGEGNPSQSTIGGGAFNDFQARFPDGATLAAGGTIIVSIKGSDGFETYFGFPPDYELYEDGDVADSVPDMRYVFGNDVTNSILDWTQDNEAFRYPGLTNDGETVILYHWIEGEDRVVDIDIFTYHDPVEGAGNYFFNKSGQTIGSHTYLSEVGTSAGLAFEELPGFGNSYQRIDAEEGAQTPQGSNGVLGADETSEDVRNTFAIQPYSPGGGGGPIEGTSTVDLYVPARTFLPREGEAFPVSFAAPTKDKAETKLRLFNLEGQVVLTIYDSQFEDHPPGSLEDRRNPWYWDGRNSTYELVRAGMYILHLSVVDLESGKEETRTAPVVVGTRLSN